MKTWLLKKLGARTEGLTADEREACARTIEEAALWLESHPAHGGDEMAQELRATGLQLIEAAARPYNETGV